MMSFNNLNTFMNERIILEFQRRIVALGFPKFERYTLDDLLSAVDISENEVERYINGYFSDKKKLINVLVWLSNQENEYVKYRDRLNISFPYVDFSKVIRNEILINHTNYIDSGIINAVQSISRVEYQMYDKIISNIDDGFYKTEITSEIVSNEKKSVDGQLKNVKKNKSNQSKLVYFSDFFKKTNNDTFSEEMIYV